MRSYDDVLLVNRLLPFPTLYVLLVNPLLPFPALLPPEFLRVSPALFYRPHQPGPPDTGPP